MIRRLSSRDPGFLATLDALLAFDDSTDEAIERTVANILVRVKQTGDAAVLDFTRRFDHLDAHSVAELELPTAILKTAFDTLPAAQKAALETAAARVRAYHEHQKISAWEYTEADGTRLGQKITPLDRVGLYVPGGKAAYPSSVLMNAIPAKVAGVGQLIMVVPTPRGEKNALVLAAAHLARVDRVFCIGGAQAVAALAYGTATIPAVDKIVGPGNAYVASAKRRVFGTVGIDMVAGPSEVLVIADGSGDPDWTAIDLFAQAEHDELAQSILLCPDAAFLDRVAASIERLLPTMPRREVIAASLSGRGALIQVTDLDEACTLSNRIAPEHLELSVAEPRALLDKIRHAGAIFMGHHTSESLGDYCAGPNHVLPTSGSARFSSPLGVYDFQKRSSLIEVSPEGAQTLGPIAAILAHGEGLTAHARAAELRLMPPGKQHGFTLVEIAIVLVIIGLLLGGILKGQELITQARIKNVANDLNGITTAVYAYQDRYKRFPGDDKGAKTRWPAATDGDGNAAVGETTLTAAAPCATTDTGENCLFWNHLRRAGFIAGDAGSAETPTNATAGFLHVQTNALGLTGLVVCSTQLSGKIAGAVDAQFDDGNPKTGSVRAGKALATNTAEEAYLDDGATHYTLCKTI